MDAVLWYGISTIIAVISVLFLRSLNNNGSKLKLPLPPGPSSVPIIGNILDLGSRPNESLAELSRKYGDIMTLRLGFATTIVVSSPAMSKEILKNNDHKLAGRAVPQAEMAHSHCYSALVFSQCNSHWRMLRRISNTSLFTAKKLEGLYNLRDLQTQRMVAYIKEAKDAVDIGQAVFGCAINVVGNMVFGKDMFHPHSQELEDFRDTVREIMVVLTLPNVADYFPFLSLLDPQGVKRRSAKAFTKIYPFLEALINERIKQAPEFRNKDDLLGALLEEKLPPQVVRNYITDLFIAGADTVSTAVEWTMVELIKNPRFLKRAQQEMDDVVGTERRVQESDLEGLDFLKAIIKESMRLHPPAPLLVPHRADEETEIGGKYRIPKHAEIVVNVWGMGRDKSIWSHDAEIFNPERFTNSEIDYKGQHFELIPFGSGRRRCVALPLATRMVHSFMASLLHSFDWSLPEPSQDLDMSDEFGLTLQKAVPLLIVPHFRLSL